MTRRPVRFILALFFFASTLAIAQRSSPPSSSSSGGHASSARSTTPSSPSFSGGGHSGGTSYSGGSSSSHANSGGGNASSHSGGWNHSGGSSSGNGNAHSNGSPGGTAVRGDHGPGANHGAPRSNPANFPPSTNRPGSQPNPTPRSVEPAPTMHGNGNRNDPGRKDGIRTSNITRPQPVVHEGAARQPNTDHRSGMSRIFLFWKHPPKNPDAPTIAKRENPELKRPKPCKGTDCKPVCVPGQTENGVCSSPSKPTKPPEQQVRCPDGRTQANGVCPAYTSTYARSFACDGLFSEIDSLEQQLQQLYASRDLECARDPNGEGCYSLTNQIIVLEQRIQQLKQQYSGCMSTHP